MAIKAILTILLVKGHGSVLLITSRALFPKPKSTGMIIKKYFLPRK
jgi:hypothetical protein